MCVLSKHWGSVFALIMGVTVLSTSCISKEAAERLALEATNNSKEVQIIQPPIPTPVGVTASPTQILPTPASDIVVHHPYATPAPGEIVQTGPIVQLIHTSSAQNSPPRYTLREVTASMIITDASVGPEVSKLFLQDSETEQEIRLGDDTGDATLALRTVDYVIWRYRNYPAIGESALQSGLYAYDLATGENIVIVQSDGFIGYPEIKGDWVIYMDHSAMGEQRSITSLHAHNLKTDQDVCISKSIPFARSFPPQEAYYALDEGKIVWVEMDMEKQQTVIQIYDISTQITHSLHAPNLRSPRNLSISGNYVIWWDSFWQGYDLQQDALFTIPVIPSGWENVPIQFCTEVTVKDSQLYWGLSVNDKIYYFRSPILQSHE